MSLARALPPARTRRLTAAWPALAAERRRGVASDGRLLAGFELAPLNLDLLADAERDRRARVAGGAVRRHPAPLPAAVGPRAARPERAPRPRGGGPRRTPRQAGLRQLRGAVPGAGGRPASAAARHLPRPRRRHARRAGAHDGAGAAGGRGARRRPASPDRRRSLAELWSVVAGGERERRLGVHLAAGDGVVAASRTSVRAGRRRCRRAGWPACSPRRAGGRLDARASPVASRDDEPDDRPPAARARRRPARRRARRGGRSGARAGRRHRGRGATRDAGRAWAGSTSSTPSC